MNNWGISKAGYSFTPKGAYIPIVRRIEIAIFLLLIIVLSITSLIGKYNLLFYVYIMYLSVLACSFHLYNIRGWYWQSMFLLLYSLPHVVMYYMWGINPFIRNYRYQEIASNIEYNCYALELVLFYISSLYLGCILFVLTRRNRGNYGKLPFGLSSILKDSRRGRNIMEFVVRYKSLVLFIVVALILGAGFYKVDYKLLFKKYNVGVGFSLLFGACYIMNFYMVFMYLRGRLKYIWLLLYVIAVGSFGVRQIIEWLFMELILAYFYKTLVVDRRGVNYKKLFLVCSSLVIFAAIVAGYRSNMKLNYDIVKNIGRLALLSYCWETSFTFYNILASIDIVNRGYSFFPFRELGDLLFLLVPSMLFPEKADHLLLLKFRRIHDIAPFGTYFLLGELKLALKYSILIVLWGVIMGWISEAFLYISTTSINETGRSDGSIARSLNITMYVSFLVYVYIYPVRGTLPSGLKLLIMNYIVYMFFRYISI